MGSSQQGQGAALGAMGGASIGTAFTPGLGTGIGAGIGALVGMTGILNPQATDPYQAQREQLMNQYQNDINNPGASAAAQNYNSQENAAVAQAQRGIASQRGISPEAKAIMNQNTATSMAGMGASSRAAMLLQEQQNAKMAMAGLLNSGSQLSMENQQANYNRYAKGMMGLGSALAGSMKQGSGYTPSEDPAYNPSAPIQGAQLNPSNFGVSNSMGAYNNATIPTPQLTNAYSGL